MMARKASICLLIYLLSLLLGSSSGYLLQITEFLKRFSNTDVHADLYLSDTLANNLRNHQPSPISWLKTLTSVPHVKIKTIIISACSSHELSSLLSTLKSIYSILGGFDLQEANHGDEWIMGDSLVEAGSLKRVTEIRGQRIGLFVEVSLKKDFKKKEFVREGHMFQAYHRQLLSNSNTKTSQHDLVYPPTTTFPTTPVTNPVTTPTFNPVTAPVTVPPDNAAPGIVTVPGMNPITVTPLPPSIPTPQPNTDPVNSPLPITNPVTTPSTNPGTQPVTNPVTTYPAPSTGVPVTTPVTTPVTPPATGNAPALPGQSWCVAKSGAPQTALQSALDYACGTGVADCSVIQQSGNCYNPNTLQNHASYAFNSYYQKKPAQTSCDFGGAAMITNTNPSAGSCIYPSSSSSPSSLPPPVLPAPVSPVPESPMPETPTPTTASNGGGATPGSGSPPVSNANNPLPNAPIGFGDIPPSAFGESPPPSMNSTASMSLRVQPFIGCIILVTTIVTGKLVLNI